MPLSSAASSGRASSRAGAVRITRHGALLSDVLRDLADEVLQRAAAAAQPRRRRGCATAPRRRARSPRRRAGAPPRRSPGRPGARGRSRSPPRRPRTPPPPPSRARSAARACSSCASGSRASIGSDIGTSKTHSASIVAPSPSASSACSSAARRPAVWTMSSSSGVPRIGTRIEPYSARSALPPQRGLRARRRGGRPACRRRSGRRRTARSRTPSTRGRRSARPRAGCRATMNAQADDDRAEQRGQRQRAVPHRDRQRHPVGARAIGLAEAQLDDRQVRDREREQRAERVDADEEVEVLGHDERRRRAPRRSR